MSKFDLRCPECHKVIQFEGNSYFPFCSDRCQMIDLGAWLQGKYVIRALDDEEEAPGENSGGNISQPKEGE